MDEHQGPVAPTRQEQRRRRIELLSDLSGAALAGLPLEELFDKVCGCAGEALDHDACALLKAEEEKLVLWAGVGWPEEAIGKASVEVTEETQAGATFLRREPIVVPDVAGEERFRESSLLREDETPAGLTALVWGPADPWGVLAVHFERPHRFAHEDAVFVQAIGHVLGRGVERRATQETLEEYAQRLEDVNEELEEFAHVVSHDLQEPIRNTHVYLELLQERCRDRLDEEEGELLTYAREGIRRAQSMLEGLRRYTRIDIQDVERRPVDTEALLDDVTAMMSARIDDSDAKIDYGSLPEVEADPAQLGQVFQNLISNGIKFAKPDQPPDIRIETEPVGDEWRFSVHDRGIGMDRQDADELFQIFRQGSSAQGEGAGIGLAVCKKIVQRHGGRIWFDTEPGEGTTFHFTVPGVEGG